MFDTSKFRFIGPMKIAHSWGHVYSQTDNPTALMHHFGFFTGKKETSGIVFQRCVA